MNRFLLNNIEINKVTEETGSWLESLKLERRNALRITLLMEEIMLRFMDRFGQDKEFFFSTGRKFGRSYLCISVEGEEFNPMEIRDEENGWGNRILANLGLNPSYSYSRGTNRIILSVSRQKKTGSNLKIIIAILAALLTGFAGMHLFAGYTAYVAESFLTPIQNSIMNLFIITALPLIFLSVMTGVFGMGSMTEFRKVGNRLILRFIGGTFICALVCGLVILPFFRFSTVRTGINIDQTSGLVKLILDMLPRNILDPFITGNTIQLIVMAVVTGLAMIALDSRTALLRSFAEEANSMAYILVEWIGKITPGLIFIIILKSMWQGNTLNIIEIWKPIVITTIGAVIITLLHIIYASIRFKVPLAKLAGKLSGPFITAFSTASSSATYGINLNCCEKKLGISKKLTGMGIPMGSVMYKPASALFFFTCALFTVEHYGMGLSFVTLVSTFIVSGLLAIAIPPVPGSAVSCFVLLFAQLNIPQEALIFAIPVDLIFDRFGTAGNILSLDAELLIQADRNNMLDRNILRK